MDELERICWDTVNRLESSKRQQFDILNPQTVQVGISVQLVVTHIHRTTEHILVTQTEVDQILKGLHLKGLLNRFMDGTFGIPDPQDIVKRRLNDE